MFQKHWIAWILLLVVVLVEANIADAQRFRWRRRNNYSYGGSVAQLASRVDDDSANYPVLDAYYDYDSSRSPEAAFRNKIRVFLRVQDEAVLNAKDSLVAEVKITDLSDSQETHVRYIPISVDRDSEAEYKPATFDVGDGRLINRLIKPARVYRLFVNVHRQSNEYGKKTVIGRVSLPYYSATSGLTRLARARQQIVMRTFRELYYAKMGWRTDEYYVMDCYAYYMWATGFCTVGAYNGHTNLGALFNAETPFTHGGEIPEIAQEDPIHGDYVRQPGHSFMLLAYDPEQQMVWTMEGNYGATIEVAVRSVSTGWSVGHLQDQHIRKGMFEETANTTKKPEESNAGDGPT